LLAVFADQRGAVVPLAHEDRPLLPIGDGYFMDVEIGLVRLIGPVVDPRIILRPERIGDLNAIQVGESGDASGTDVDQVEIGLLGATDGSANYGGFPIV